MEEIKKAITSQKGIKNPLKSEKPSLQKLNLIDDFLFSKVMRDSEICRQLLEEILAIKIDKIVIKDTEKSINLNYDSHGIRLDVYVRDSEGTVYEVEMEKGRKSHIPKRGRYYQSSIDGECLEAGVQYKELPKSFIIFICNFDWFGKGRHIYTFENRCIQDLGLEYGDGTMHIVLNTRGTRDDVSPAIAEFLRYVEESTDRVAEVSRTEFIKNLHNRVIDVKRNKDLGVEFVTLQEKFDEYRGEGIELGEDRKQVEIATRMLKKGVTVELVADYTELTIEQVLELVKA